MVLSLIMLFNMFQGFYIYTWGICDVHIVCNLVTGQTHFTKSTNSRNFFRLVKNITPFINLQVTY